MFLGFLSFLEKVLKILIIILFIHLERQIGRISIIKS